MEAMEMKEIEAAVEGILFASGEPVAADRIAVALDLDRDTVDQVLRRQLAELSKKSGTALAAERYEKFRKIGAGKENT